MVILSFYAQNCLPKWAGEKFLFHCSARFSWILIWWINTDFDADFKNGLISDRICSVLPQNWIIIFIFFTKKSEKRRNLAIYKWIIQIQWLWIYTEYKRILYFSHYYRVIQVKLDVTKQLFQTENNQWGSKMGFVHVL